jgi:hypothetical protein
MRSMVEGTALVLYELGQPERELGQATFTHGTAGEHPFDFEKRLSPVTHMPAFQKACL